MRNSLNQSQYSQLNLLDQALVDKAVAMTDTAYAPYSGFLVGAA
ncbi:MAG TPA: cytidine deaminase, partial [Saprospirales bacterium]|nr:cytidine deaminase [Saprospirales bacterium]